MRRTPEAVVAYLRTEKGVRLEAQRQYVFRAHVRANKHSIKRAVEELFKVKVTQVTTMMVRGKQRRLRFARGRRPDWKKAYVTVAEGQHIEVK